MLQVLLAAVLMAAPRAWAESSLLKKMQSQWKQIQYKTERHIGTNHCYCNRKKNMFTKHQNVPIYVSKIAYTYYGKYPHVLLFCQPLHCTKPFNKPFYSIPDTMKLKIIDIKRKLLVQTDILLKKETFFEYSWSTIRENFVYFFERLCRHWAASVCLLSFITDVVMGQEFIFLNKRGFFFNIGRACILPIPRGIHVFFLIIIVYS